MKRLFLIVALCLTATWVSASEYRMGGRPERQFWVIASNAPANARRGGPNVYLCDGANDEIQLNAAIAAANAAGGGDVMLSQGLFVLDADEAGETYWNGSGDTTYVDADTMRITPDGGAFDAGAWANVEAGQYVRVYDGTRSGNSIQDDKEELIGLVEAIDSGTSFDLLIQVQASRAWTSVNFDRIVACVRMKQNVNLIGQGVNATQIKLNDDVDRTLIMFDEPTAARYNNSRIANLYLNGNDSGQSKPLQDEDSSSVLANGIVWGFYDRRIMLDNIRVASCDADGIFAGGAEGLEMRNVSVDSCDEIGCVIDRGDPCSVTACRFYGNDQAGVKLRHSALVQFSNCYFRSDEDYGTRLAASTDNSWEGCQWYMYNEGGSATPLGGLYIAGAANQVTGCRFYTLIANARAITVTSAENLIANNYFHRDYHDVGTVNPIDFSGAGAAANTVYGNIGLTEEMECKSSKYLNATGDVLTIGTVVNRFSDTVDIWEVAATTTDVDKAIGVVVADDDGLVSGTVANSEYCYVQTCGLIKNVIYDNAAVAAQGAELSASGQDAGALQAAASGDWVVAICAQANTDGDNDPTTTTMNVIWLAKPYLKP